MTVRLIPVLVAAAAAAACSPGIGDACSTNSDCGSNRVCDTSQPGGYCTASPCKDTGCPSEAVCVDFGTQTSYCMQQCGPFAFCREGYECVENYAAPDDPEKVYKPFCNQRSGQSSPDASGNAPDAPTADLPAGG